MALTKVTGELVDIGDLDISNVGSIQLDSIAGDADTNTTIAFPGSDVITMSTGGSERLRVDASGRLLIGYGTSTHVRAVEGAIQVQGTNLDTSSINAVRYSADAYAPILSFGKSRNASAGGQTIVQDGDACGTIAFAGSDGTDLENRVAQIVAQVDGTPGSNDMPGRLIFETTADGAAASTERMRIDSSGKVGINTSSPGAWLEVKDDGSLGHDMVLIQGGGSSGDYNALAVKANNGNELFKVNASSYHTYLPNGSCKLGIGMASGAGHSLDVAGDAQISKAGNGNDPILHVIDTADTEVAWFEGQRAADTGAFISIYHNPSSIAESNRSGIKFQGQNDADEKVTYGQILQRHTDYTDGTEDGELQIHQIVDGTLEEKLTITPDQLRFRGDAGSSIIRVDNRADGHDTGFEIYQNTSRKWEIHSDDSQSDCLSIRNASGTEKFRFLQGGGITFNGDTASANALDDYEEGTWTPQIKGYTGTNVSIGTVSDAVYTRVGRLVYISAYLLNINIAGMTDGTYVVIHNLPFASDADNYAPITLGYNNTNIAGGYVENNGFVFLNNSSGTEFQQQNNDITPTNGTARFMIGITLSLNV